jgi:hypothetical protein
MALTALAAIVLCVLVIAVIGRSWLVLLVLLIPTYIFGDWFSDRVFGNQSPLNRLSIAEAGFSVRRIVFAVLITIPLLLTVLTAFLGIDFLRRLVGF